MKKVCGLTFKCRKNESCENFENYFDVIDSSHGTRNNKYSIRLPKVRLETAKNGLYFLGGKLFNELPLEIRQVENLKL